MDKNIENNIVLYQDENGITNVNVRFSDEDLWLTQSHIAEIYASSQQNIRHHIESIYKDNELSPDRTCKYYLQVQIEGQRQVKRDILQSCPILNF
ncbi:MAG: hypothetical protein FWG98_05100 [Candidatus Cloacimonetes bacterium]|nr:hypothetical protein [Candidatus Cloacimonadota bacterium]